MEQINKQLDEIMHMLSQMEANTTADDADLYLCPLCRDCGFILRDGRAYPCSCQAESLLAQKKNEQLV